MKKLFTLLMLVATVSISYSQVLHKKHTPSKKGKHKGAFYKTQESTPALKLDSLESDYDIFRYTYNSKGQLVTEIYETFEGNPYEEEVRKEKYEYTYDHAGDMVLEIDYYYNYDTEEWIPSYKAESTFGEEWIDIDYEWNEDEETWDLSNKHVYTLKTANLVDTYTRYYWDGESWVEDLVYEYEYNESNQIISETESGIFGATTTYTYEDGLLAEKVIDNTGSQDWKTEYFYTGDKKLSYWIESFMYEEVWYESKQKAFGINKDILLKDIYMPYTDWYQDYFDVQLIDVKFYNMSDGEFEYEVTNTYYYSSTATTTLNAATAKANVTIYPNPTSDRITISSSEYTNAVIYNSLGNVVSNVALTGNTVYVENLNCGLYTLELLSNKGEVVRSNFVKR